MLNCPSQGGMVLGRVRPSSRGATALWFAIWRAARRYWQHSLMIGDVVITECLENCRTNWTNTIGGRCFDRFRSRPLSWIPTLENQRKLQTHTLRYCKCIGSQAIFSRTFWFWCRVCVLLLRSQQPRFAIHVFHFKNVKSQVATQYVIRW